MQKSYTSLFLTYQTLLSYPDLVSNSLIHAQAKKGPDLVECFGMCMTWNSTEVHSYLSFNSPHNKKTKQNKKAQTQQM